MIPTLPFSCRRARRYRIAPSMSPIVRSSGMPPASRTLAELACGRRLAFAEVQVRTDGGVAMLGEPAGDLDGRLVPAGHVMDDHDAGVVASARRPREVGVDRVAVVPAHLHGLARDRAVEDPARRGRGRGLRWCGALRRLRRAPQRPMATAPTTPEAAPVMKSLRLMAFSVGSGRMTVTPFEPHVDESWRDHALAQHFLNLRPLPHGHGSLRPALGSACMASARSCSISASGCCPCHSSAAIRSV